MKSYKHDKNGELEKQLIMFARYQKDRVNNKEIPPSTVPNYFKAIKLFSIGESFHSTPMHYHNIRIYATFEVTGQSPIDDYDVSLFLKGISVILPYNVFVVATREGFNQMG
jgi:hypothetical protein